MALGGYQGRAWPLHKGSYDLSLRFQYSKVVTRLYSNAGCFVSLIQVDLQESIARLTVDVHPHCGAGAFLRHLICVCP